MEQVLFNEKWRPVGVVTAFAKFGKGNISKGKARAYLNKFGAGSSKKILRDT